MAPDYTDGYIDNPIAGADVRNTLSPTLVFHINLTFYSVLVITAKSI